MLRFLGIAIVSLASFFSFFIGLSWLGSSNAASAVAALLLGFLGMPVLLLRIWKPGSPGSKCPGGEGLYPECLYVVILSPTEVRVTHPKRPVESVPLAELTEVQIATNDSGPFGADLSWLLLGGGSHRGCSFPGGATGEKAVLEFVQQLPGFRNEVFIQSMGSTSNARFSCWRAPAPNPSIERTA